VNYLVDKALRDMAEKLKEYPVGQVQQKKVED
jgi:hypothetical protein